ncbi:MAG: hypothetical protein NTW87_27860 [Planctomycetota bacterium]|nr:hypothetical protein [Planctomycetota bacterium]
MKCKLWGFCLAAGALLFLSTVHVLNVGAAQNGEANRCADDHAPHQSRERQQAVAEADNSYCFVCHANYKDEILACIHQRVGVGCPRCHGESDKHSSDEDGLTPPDVIYPKDVIDQYCRTCHVPAMHEPLPFGDPAKASCTSCHGKAHVLNVRTRRWDKVTRKLISDDGVRMLTPAKDK